jgi:predicted ATP-grasp superfamily ATP-dependent carboligase
MRGAKTKRDDGVPRKIAHPVRFAADEYEELRRKANQAQISISEFIRRAATNKQIRAYKPPPQVNRKFYQVGLATRGFTGDFPVGLLHHYRYSKRYAVEAVLGCGGLVGVELVSCHSSFVFRLMSYVICCLFPVLGSFDSAEMYN